MRILTAPDHQHFALNFADAIEGVVFHALAEASLVDVGGVEAGGGENAGIHGGAEGEVAADADADCAEFVGAVGARFEMREDGAGVGVVAGKFLGDFVGVAFVCAGLVVGNDRPDRFQLMENFRRGDDEAMAGQQRGGATDGAGDLENLGKKQQAGIFSVGGGPEDVGAHRPGGGLQLDNFFFDGHGDSRISGE
jgi:hypothetical protein